MEDDRNILAISDLCVAFGRIDPTTVLHGIDQIVPKGKVLGVVGESGSGKSVTALSILRLLPEGHSRILNGSLVYYDNQGAEIDLLAIGEEDIRSIRGNEIAMVFQEPMTSLNPVFTCGEQVAEVIRLHRKKNFKEAKELSKELFEKVQLHDPERVYNSYPHQLSGGQKQRVMIAMALSCQPRLLIADEPTTALDVTVQAEIISLLKDLQRDQDLSVIFITHDLGVVSEIADYVTVMYKGEIVESGPVQQIFSSPQHNYTKGLLECRPSLKHRMKRLPTVKDLLDESVKFNLDDYKYDPVEYRKRSEKISAANTLISVRNVSLTYTKDSQQLFKKPEVFKALNNISFDIKKGETLGLVGESGCGKSTLGKAIARLIEPDEGEILYNGRDLLKLSSSDMRTMRRKIQIIFQDPYASLNPRMKIGNAIAEPMLFHGLVKGRSAARKATEHLLTKVGLKEEHFARYPHEFSGGQRQRIGIARALAMQPEFIICDESVSALDVSVQAQVLNLLVDLREEFGLTYLFISHDLSVINFISDRIMVMKSGQIEEIATPDQLFNETSSEYTRRLIDSIPGT